MFGGGDGGSLCDIVMICGGSDPGGGSECMYTCVVCICVWHECVMMVVVVMCVSVCYNGMK